jgi:citrate lyase subunit beta/citryl-CoA lyase
MLFIPPAKVSMLARAIQAEADALILDWEDATPRDDKAEARCATLAYLASRPPDKHVWVRVNGMDSEYFEDDVKALRIANPTGVVLPKCDSARAVARLSEAEVPGLLMPLIESAAGLLEAAEIARCMPRIAALGFGAEDFCADTDILASVDGLELLYARSAIVVAARAAGIEPIDSPCFDYRNSSVVEASAKQARCLGFGGKMAIHPGQLPILNSAFTPSEAELQSAREVLARLKSQRDGAAGIGGMMVDEASARRARRTLQRARP